MKNLTYKLYNLEMQEDHLYHIQLKCRKCGEVVTYKKGLHLEELVALQNFFNPPFLFEDGDNHNEDFLENVPCDLKNIILGKCEGCKRAEEEEAKEWDAIFQAELEAMERRLAW